DVALEDLTFDERNLLGNLRSYAQFRQGFYTQVAIGELGVSGPTRGFRSTSVNVFSGQGEVNGYVGLLQRLQRIRNSEDNLSLQLRTLAQLEDRLDAGLIDLVQVDQFRQSVERERAQLLQARNQFELFVDSFKTRTLGLPPDLEVDLDDQLIDQFQLIARESTQLRNSVARMQDRVGGLENDAPPEEIEAVRSDVLTLFEPIGDLFEAINQDLRILREALPKRKAAMSSEDQETLEQEVALLEKSMREQTIEFAELKASLSQLEENDASQQAAPNDLPPPAAEQMPNEDETGTSESAELPDSIRQIVSLLQRMMRLIDGAALVQARARLESVSIDPINLEPRTAYQIALTNRLDFMNARASLVDSWRLIQVRADALQSVLNVTASGDVRTNRNNPLSFRGATANARLGLQFDAPFTRLLERNAYRESLISYQRSRRDFIQSRDRLHQGLRVLLRQLELLRASLEIQRRAVAIAIRRVDLTSRDLDAPVRPAQPGQRDNIGCGSSPRSGLPYDRSMPRRNDFG
ncbi:MAG: TolC family protein, partial [Planctomycetota bacterium]